MKVPARRSWNLSTFRNGIVRTWEILPIGASFRALRRFENDVITWQPSSSSQVCFDWVSFVLVGDFIRNATGLQDINQHFHNPNTSKWHYYIRKGALDTRGVRCLLGWNISKQMLLKLKVLSNRVPKLHQYWNTASNVTRCWQWKWTLEWRHLSTSWHFTRFYQFLATQIAAKCSSWNCNKMKQETHFWKIKLKALKNPEA